MDRKKEIIQLLNKIKYLISEAKYNKDWAMVDQLKHRKKILSKELKKYKKNGKICIS